MTKDDTEIVSALQSALADKVGKDRYEMWFGANARIALEADTVKVSVPNRFYQDWLRTNFRRQIEESCVQALGRSLPISFHIAEPPGRSCQKTLGQPSTVAAGSGGVQLTLHGAEEEEATSQNVAPAESAHACPPLPRRRFANFESFVTGAGNRLAAASAADVVENLGRTSPLVIHGPTSVGKTHLLEAIWSGAKRRYPRLHAVYLTAEQFTSYFLEALHASGVPNFRNKYRGVDLLLIDDLQFFAGKRATLGELLHTIDNFTRDGRQLVFAADRPPAALAGLGPELTGRLSAGLICRIDPQDYETRRGIVAAQAVRMGFDLPADVADFIAQSFRDHARELIGALVKLQATARAWGRSINLALAEEALGETIAHCRAAVQLVDVQQAVCEVFGIEPASLRSGRRTSAVAHPRMLAMWLARKHTRAALAEIGEFFGNRTHTTVISANKKVGEWMNDPQSVKLADHTLTLAEAVRKVEERLRAS